MAFLLDQTDEYVASLTNLVAQHKLEMKKKKRAEEKQAEKERKAEEAAKFLVEVSTDGNVCFLRIAYLIRNFFLDSLHKIMV